MKNVRSGTGKLIAVISLAMLGACGYFVACFVSAALPVRSRAADRPLEWGIYQIYWRPQPFEQALKAEAERFSKPPDYVMFYRDLSCPFPRRAVEIIRARGAVPIVSLELWQWHASRVKRLPQINAGQYDAFFESWARAARADGGRVMLRFGFEFNGDWFNWSLEPEAFVTAWKRVHSIFAREKASNVEWVWSPNVVSVPNTPANDMHRYYPGDALVDWVGVDGYNWGNHYGRWHKWQSCADIFSPVLAEFAQRYPKHPVMLAEFGSVEGDPGQKARWIREAHAWLIAQSRISAAIWFNYDKRREGEHDWRIGSSRESLAAFNATFAGG